MNAQSRLLLTAAILMVPGQAHGGAAELHKAVTLYASFDEEVKADKGGGELTLSTRTNHPTEKGKFVFKKGFDTKAFRIEKDRGVHGGTLEAVDVLPDNGRVFFPAKGNIAFKKGGWGGAVSVWINTDPNKLLKTKFCDPIQITQKGANNGGIWFDFNDAKPRDLRLGVFRAVPEGKMPIKEEDPDAPMVRVPKIDFKSGDWHHVVLSWQNFDTGKKDATATLHIDGVLLGTVKDRDIAMMWDIDQAGIYVAVNYIGLLDELAVFDRPLTDKEISELLLKPGLLSGLKKKAGAKAPAAPKFPFDADTARQFQKAYADWRELPVEFTNDLGMTFVLVPPGTFIMGSPEDEPGRNGGGYIESPMHQVTLTKPFYLSKHETTVGQFEKFVKATKYVTDGEKNGGGNAHDALAIWKHKPGTNWLKPGYAGAFEMKVNHPAVHVSHTDALAFCAWLQQQPQKKTIGTKLTAGLPTEAQWEWACRAGSATRFWWGADEDMSGKVANVGDKSLKKVHPLWPRTIMPMDDGHAFPAPVGSYQANGFGLCDMLGNVWEFCSTRYGPYPKGPVTDPTDGDPKRGFAVRGGGWSNVAGDARCATRNADPPHFCHSNLGFRVALMLTAE